MNPYSRALEFQKNYPASSTTFPCDDKDPHAKFHEATTRVPEGKNLDHAYGRVIKINGNLFYSPNLGHRTPPPTVELPPPVEQNKNIWRQDEWANAHEFHRPLWWSEETAYLAFWPIEPLFGGEPFGELFSVPNWFNSIRGGFMMDFVLASAWKTLERELREIARSLLHFYRVPTVLPIIETAVTCTGLYKKVGSFRQAIKRSRNWFAAWMSQVSYAIAVALTFDGPAHPDMFPAWFQILVEISKDKTLKERWDQPYLSGVRQTMGTFGPHIPRAGVFLNISSPPPYQPSVDWFLGFHVPVFYPWGAKEVAAARVDPNFQRLAPPSHLLQQTASALLQQPRLPAATTSSGTATSLSAVADDKPWVAFLAQQERRKNEAIASESPAERQTRLNRERKPPTSNAKVFVWEKDDKGIYRRRLESKKYNGNTLGSYGRDQKTYNAVSNEWDCYGEGYNSDEDISDEDTSRAASPYSGGPADSSHTEYPASPLRPTPPSYVDPSASRPVSSSTPSSSDATRHLSSSTAVAGSSSVGSSSVGSSVNVAGTTYLSATAENHIEMVLYEMTDLLSNFYGYVPPLPVPSSRAGMVPLSEEEMATLAHLVGISSASNTAIARNSPLSNSLREFLAALNKKTVPRNERWDLSLSNRQCLLTSPRLGCIRRCYQGEMLGNGHQDCLYVFDFGEHATVNWLLAVTNIIDALFVCRLGPQMTDYHICLRLLDRGISVRTLLPLAIVLPSPPPPVVLPFRLSGYRFSARDYEAYVHERNALLCNPRIARAALMKGGIIWRLVNEEASFSDVVSGPTSDVHIFRRGELFNCPAGPGDLRLWDDIVTDDELAIICGTVICFTG